MTTNDGEDSREESLFTVDGNVDLCSHKQEAVGSSVMRGNRGLGSASVAKSTCCCAEDPVGSISGPQPSVTSVPRKPSPSSGPHRY